MASTKTTNGRYITIRLSNVSCTIAIHTGGCIEIVELSIFTWNGSLAFTCKTDVEPEPWALIAINQIVEGCAIDTFLTGCIEPKAGSANWSWITGGCLISPIVAYACWVNTLCLIQCL